MTSALIPNIYKWFSNLGSPPRATQKFKKLQEEIVPIRSLNTPMEGCCGVSLATAQANLIAKYYMLDSKGDKKNLGQLKFNLVEMHSFSAEPFSVGFKSEYYDCVCEIKNSVWAQENDRRSHKAFPIKHFAVYFNNSGLLEVASNDIEIEIYED